MAKSYLNDLVTDLKNGDVILFVGPQISEANGYPAYLKLIAHFAEEEFSIEKKQDESIDEYIRNGNYMKAAEWCARRFDAKPQGLSFTGRIVEIYNRHRKPAILYQLLAEIPVKAIVSANIDDLLPQSLQKQNIPCLSWAEGRKALDCLKKGEPHLVQALGAAKHPDTLILTFLKNKKASRTTDWRQYYIEAMKIGKILALGFDSSDPLLAGCLQIAREHVPNPEPWYAFFAIAPGPEYVPPIPLRIIPPENPEEGSPETSDIGPVYQDFLTRLIEKMPGRNRIQATIPRSKATPFGHLTNTLVNKAKENTNAGLFYSGCEATWGIVAKGLDARRDLEPEIKAFLRVQDLRIATIMAPSGYGKSTIAHRIAYDLWINERFEVFWVNGPSRFPPDLIIRLKQLRDQDVLVVVDRAHDLSDLHLRVRQWKRDGQFRLRLLLAGRTHEINEGAIHLNAIQAAVTLKEFRITWISPTEAERFVETLRQHNCLGDLEKTAPAEQAQVFKNTGKGDLLAALLQCTRGQALPRIVADVCENVASWKDGLFLLRAYALVAALDRWSLSCSRQLFTAALDLDPGEIYDRILDRLPGELGMTLGSRNMEVRHREISKAACEFLFDPEKGLIAPMEIYGMIFQGAAKLGQKYEIKLASILPLMFKKSGDIENARKLFESATSHLPADAPAWQAWAVMEMEQDDIPRARELFERATQADPSNAPSWRAWAKMEKGRNNIPEARNLFNKAVTADPYDPPTWRAWEDMEARADDPSGKHFFQKTADHHGYKTRLIHGAAAPSTVTEERDEAPEATPPDAEPDLSTAMDAGEQIPSGEQEIDDPASRLPFRPEKKWPFNPRWITENLGYDDIRKLAYLLAGLSAKLCTAVMVAEVKNGRSELLAPVNRTTFYPTFCKGLFSTPDLKGREDHPCREDIQKRIMEVHSEYQATGNLDKPLIKECHLGFRSLYYPFIKNGGILGYFIIGKEERADEKEMREWKCKRQEFRECHRQYFEGANGERTLMESSDIHYTEPTPGQSDDALFYFFNKDIRRGLSRVGAIIDLLHNVQQHRHENEFLARLNREIALPLGKTGDGLHLPSLVHDALHNLRSYIGAGYVSLFLGMEPRDRYLQLVSMSREHKIPPESIPIAYLDRGKAKIPDEITSDAAWQFDHYRQDIAGGAFQGRDSVLFADPDTVIPFSRLGHVGAVVIGGFDSSGVTSYMTSLNRLGFDLGLQLIGLHLLKEYSRRRDLELLGYSLFVHSLRSMTQKDASAINLLKRYLSALETEDKEALKQARGWIERLEKSGETFGRKLREGLAPGGGAAMIQVAQADRFAHRRGQVQDPPRLMDLMAKNVVSAYESKKKNKNMSIRYDERSPTDLLIGVFPQLFEKMIATLIGNALFHGKEGSAIDLRWARLDGNLARFEITGISSVIEPGEDIWAPPQESGLSGRPMHGLYIVRSIAEALGGEAGHEPEGQIQPEAKHQEHTFWFTYPVSHGGKEDENPIL